MAENKQYINQHQEFGSVLISEDVICTIVTRAVEEVDGVAGFSNANKKNWGKGIKVNVSEKNHLCIDCYINVVYGQSVVAIASAVQDAVSNAVFSMTGIKAKAVNVNVSGIVRK